MAISNFPIVFSPIKSVQRGNALSAGNITIASINTSRSFVKSYSTGSSGYVGVVGTETGTLVKSGGSIVGATGASGNTGGGSAPTYSGTRTVTPLTTSLTVAEYGVYISNSTTLVATGPCRWEVIEYN